MVYIKGSQDIVVGSVFQLAFDRTLKVCVLSEIIETQSNDEEMKDFTKL